MNGVPGVPASDGAEPGKSETGAARGQAASSVRARRWGVDLKAAVTAWLTAGLFAYLSYCHFAEANRLERELAERPPMLRLLGDGFGLGSVIRIKIGETRGTGTDLAVAAGLLGVFGLALGLPRRRSDS